MASPMQKNMLCNKDPLFSLNLSGPVLAGMIYDMLNREGDQEGFLIGEVITQRTEGISDTEMNIKKEQNIVCIHHCVPCDSVFSFYNELGHVDEARVKSTVGSHYKDLIGWYTFRRNTTLDVMLRERAVCNNLGRLLPASRKPFQTFGIFTYSARDKHSMQVNDYVFLRQTNRFFVPVPVVVVNLGDTSQVEYKTTPLIFLHNNIGYYDGLLKPKTYSKKEVPTFSSMDQVRNVQKQLQTKLEAVCRELHDLEHQSEILQNEIHNVREQINQTNQDRLTSSDQDKQQDPNNQTDIVDVEDVHLMSFEDDDETIDVDTIGPCGDLNSRAPLKKSVSSPSSDTKENRITDPPVDAKSVMGNHQSAVQMSPTINARLPRDRKPEDDAIVLNVRLPPTRLTRHASKSSTTTTKRVADTDAQIRNSADIDNTGKISNRNVENQI